MTNLVKRDNIQKQAEQGEITGSELWKKLKLSWEGMSKDERAQEFSKLAAFALGRRGGSSKSPAKQAASRLNGRKGGRPRKDKS